jgi:hypothetical protein
LLHGDDDDLQTRTVALASVASAAQAVRTARFLTHLLVGHPKTTAIIFKLLRICLERTGGSDHHDTVKSIIFGSSTFRDYCVTERGNEYRDRKSTGGQGRSGPAYTPVLHPIVSSLDIKSPKDTALAETITSRLVHMLKKPKKYGLAQV